MKQYFRPYTTFLLKQNTAVLVAAGLLVFATAGLAFYMNEQLANLNNTITKTREEIRMLTAKRAALRSVVGEGPEDLDGDLELMSALIPDSEDYFSIINALESLSRQTGFRIDSYTINLLASTSNRLSLTVTGNGDNDTFLTFLQSYQLNGGRLITAESIGIDPQETGSIRLDLNFYNKQVSADTATASAGVAPPSLAELNAIKSKITFSFTAPPEPDAALGDYETKTDPF